MKDSRFLRRFGLILTCVSFAQFSTAVSVWAQEPQSTQTTEPRTTQQEELHGTSIQEAIRAVTGQVFGVEGEAVSVDYNVIEMTRHTPGNAAFRSLLVPGWGQSFNDQKVKGVVLFLSTLVAVGTSVTLNRDANDSYNEYKAKGVQDDPSYNDYTDKRSAAIVFGAFGALLWGYSVWDAYRNAYVPLWSQDLSLDVALADDGGRLRLRKKFG